MTEFNENTPQDKPEWDKIIGPTYALESLPHDLQDNLGLVVLRFEDGAVCPEAQFRPETEDLVLVPTLADAWQFARERNSEHDQTGLETFLVFVTPQNDLESKSFWDVLVSEDGTKELDGIKHRIVDALPKHD